MQEPMLQNEEEPQNESTVEGSSCYTGENTPPQIYQPASDHVAFVSSDAAGSSSVSVSNPPPRVARLLVGETSRSGRRLVPYPCRRWFSTAQNQRASLRYPFGYSNSFVLPRPPFPYPQSTTGLTPGQLGQPSDMLLDSMPFPVLDTSTMFFANILNNANANYTSGSSNFGRSVGGGQGGSNLQGSAAPNANINSVVRGGLNSMGMVGARGRGNSCFPFGGFEGAGTSSGVVRNYFGGSQDESEVRGPDGTIDLLSRVGMGSGEDEESNSKSGNGDGEA